MLLGGLLFFSELFEDLLVLCSLRSFFVLLLLLGRVPLALFDFGTFGLVDVVRFLRRA